MAQVMHKGNRVHTRGDLPAVGSKAPDFRLTRSDLTDVSLASFPGKKKILNIVPSLDTRVCALSAKRFNQEVATLDNVVCLTISNDLPYAQRRFCDAEGIKNVITLSQLRDRNFGMQYGAELVDGTMEGLLSRAVVVLDESDRVIYSEQVPDIGQEPDYARALQAVR